jgi:putative DNA primase/helicase
VSETRNNVTSPQLSNDHITPEERRLVLHILAKDKECPELLAAAQKTYSDKFAKEPLPPAKPSSWQDMVDSIGPIEWDLHGWFAKAIAIILAANSGVGKSILALRIAATYIRGDCWPDGTPYTGELGSVLWIETEAGEALNLERARNWNLPLEKILTPFADTLQTARLDNEEDRATIEAVAQRADIKLIIVDSLRGAHRGEENSNDAADIVFWLAALARNTGKPVLILHHLRKRGMLDGLEEVTLDQLRGYSGIVQAARIVWAINKPDRNSDTLRLAVVKNNLCRFPEPMGFEISDDGITFTDAPTTPKAETQLDKARDMLQALLSNSQSRPQTYIKEQLEGAGISWATVTRAKNKLYIKSEKIGTIWMWSIPQVGVKP